MRASATRPNAKLIAVKQAESEYGLPEGLLRDLVARGELAAVRPPGCVVCSSCVRTLSVRYSGGVLRSVSMLDARRRSSDVAFTLLWTT